MRRPGQFAAPILAAVFLLAGCKAQDAVNFMVPTGHLEITRDQAYGANPRQELDVYRPVKAARGRSLPLIVFFYGGGWSMGERQDYLFVAEALARRGFVVAIPDYRLYPEVRFPAFVDDGAAAIKWLHTNADRFGIDTSRIFLAGHSAGAHTMALLAIDPRYLQAHGLPPETIRAAAGISGPYWFRTWTLPAYAPIFQGAPREETRPINFVSPGDPPMLLLHGLADETVKPTNTRRFADKLREAGVPVEVGLYPDVDHVKIIAAVATPLPIGPPVADRVAAFLHAAPPRN